MKKFISALLSILMIVSAVPSYAAEKYISLNPVVADTKTGEVTVSGKLEGYKYSYWRKSQVATISVIESGTTPDGAVTNQEKIFHLAETPVSENGEFTYTYSHKSKKEYDTCVVRVQSDSFTGASTSYSFYNAGSQNELLENSGAVIVGSPLYYAGETSAEGKKAPYIKDGSIYIPADMAATILAADYNEENGSFVYNGVTFTGDVTAAQLSAAGAVLHEYPEYGIVYFGNEITQSQAESLIPMFGIYVSVNGNDYASGTIKAPVRTINKALELYHTTAENGFIFVQEGIYEETISIDSSYSNLTIKGLGEVAVRTPSVKISAESFTKTKDSEALLKLPSQAAKHVLCAPVPGFNETMTDLDYGDYYKAFQGEKEVKVARFPNGGGFVTASSVYETENTKTEMLIYEDIEKLEKWGQEKDIYAISFRECGYNFQDKRILSTDPENKTLTFDIPKALNAAQKMGKRFSVYNALCELDAPGEWFIDREKEVIYYYPLPDFESLELVAESKDLITINGAKNIKIENIEISRTRRNGVTIRNASGIKLIDCEIKDIGRNGILTDGAVNSTVDGCEVHNVLGQGININYKGSSYIDKDLIYQNNLVQNCTVYNIGLKNVIAGAIYMSGTGNKVSHNTIFNIPHMAIWFCGNDNIIEYNDCYNCLKYCDDAGVLYGNPGIRGFGNIVQYNYVHDFHTLNAGAGELYMIYLDADTSGTLVQGNIVDIRNKPLNTALGLIGGGRNNVLKENILLGSAHNGQTALWMSNRYSKTAAYHNQLVSGLGVYNFVQGLTAEQRDLWFTKYEGFKDEYGFYEKYVNDKAAGIENDGSDLGVARECIVTDNIIVSDWFKTKGYNTYDQKMKAGFGDPATVKTGLRYDKNLSTGNQFLLLSEYDPTEAVENMDAGSGKMKALSEKELSITYPQNNSVVKVGDTRLFWDKETGAGEYTAKVYDVNTNTLIHQETTIENFVDVSLTEGSYRFELTARDYDGSAVLTDATEFECSDSEISLIKELDLFENDTNFAVGDTGTIAVYATNSEGERFNAQGAAGLKITSSNTEVMTVDASGRYTAKEKGITVVTAAYKGITKKMTVFVTDTVYDEVTADKLSGYAGASQITAAENPVSEKQAMVLSGANEQNISSFAPVSDVSSYFMSAWVYDEGINVNAPRFGAWSDAGLKVRFGAENEASAVYKLLPGSDDAISKTVDIQIKRSGGWHQVFAEVVYDENETLVSGSTQIKGVTTVSFYFDGELAAQIKSGNKIYPNLLETGENVKFLDRVVAKYYESPRYISEEQKLEVIKNIQDAAPEKAQEVFEASREYLDLDYTDFDALNNKAIIYKMLTATDYFTSTIDFYVFFDECVVLVKALEENDLSKVEENKEKWGIGSLSVYQDYLDLSAEERKVINDKILVSGFKDTDGFAALFKTITAEKVLKNKLKEIKEAEAQNNADYMLLYALLSEKSDVYEIDFTEYTALSGSKKLKAITKLYQALYDKEAITTQIIQQEFDLIIEAIQNEVSIVDIDISNNRTMFSAAESDEMIGQINVTAFYDNNTKGDISGKSNITYTSSDKNLVRIYPDGRYKINGSGMAVITVNCETIEKSMVFYSTAEAPYRRDLTETVSDTDISVTSDPVYGSGKAMKLKSGSYENIKINGVITTSASPTKYMAGVWVYDKGAGENIPYFGIGRYSSVRVQYGARNKNAEYYTLHMLQNNSMSGTISEEVQIPREVGWHHIFAKVSYDNSKTTTEFYFDGRYVGKTVTNPYNPPCYLYTGSGQEFKERYVAVYYAENVTTPVELLKREYEYTTEDNKTKLTVSLISNDEIGTIKAKLIFACKNSFGVVTSVKIYPLDIAPLGKITESIEAPQGTKIEAFIWDGVSPMTPLFEKIDS